MYAWDNYPLDQFPPVWRWIAGEIAAMRLSMPLVAFEEACNVAPDCGQWLTRAQLTVLPMGNAVAAEANRIKGLLGIVGDRFGAGVGENDLFIVASAKLQGLELVSNESMQPALPRNMLNYKIPAVCSMPTVGVRCYSFLSCVKQSGQVF